MTCPDRQITPMLNEQIVLQSLPNSANIHLGEQNYASVANGPSGLPVDSYETHSGTGRSSPLTSPVDCTLGCSKFGGPPAAELAESGKSDPWWHEKCSNFCVFQYFSINISVRSDPFLKRTNPGLFVSKREHAGVTKRPNLIYFQIRPAPR